MAKNRSKRLRKKLYVDEFAVFGFEFSCHLSINTESEYNTLLDGFFDFLEDRNLIMGGGANHGSFDGFIVPEGRYDSATEADRKAVEAWLTKNANCSEIQISPLVDINLDN